MGAMVSTSEGVPNFYGIAKIDLLVGGGGHTRRRGSALAGRACLCSHGREAVDAVLGLPPGPLAPLPGQPAPAQRPSLSSFSCSSCNHHSVMRLCAYARRPRTRTRRWRG